MAKRNPSVWDFLAACRKCGKAHYPHAYRGGGADSPGVTWVDPEDGHGYAPRVNPEIVNQLHAEYNTAIGAGIPQQREPLGKTTVTRGDVPAQ